MVVAQPVGKGQLVPIWHLHLEFVVVEGHEELQWEGRHQGGRSTLERGHGSAWWARVPYHLGSLLDILLRPLPPLTSP